MKFKAIKSFSSIRWGNVKPGDYINLEKDTARQMIDAGMVELSQEMRDSLRAQAEVKKEVKTEAKADLKVKN